MKKTSLIFMMLIILAGIAGKVSAEPIRIPGCNDLENFYNNFLYYHAFSEGTEAEMERLGFGKRVTDFKDSDFELLEGSYSDCRVRNPNFLRSIPDIDYLREFVREGVDTLRKAKTDLLADSDVENSLKAIDRQYSLIKQKAMSHSIAEADILQLQGLSHQIKKLKGISKSKHYSDALSLSDKIDNAVREYKSVVSGSGESNHNLKRTAPKEKSDEADQDSASNSDDLIINNEDNVNNGALKGNAWSGWVLNEYTVSGLLITIILGVILGIKKKITVFRDYNDLGLIFLLVIFPVVFLSLAGFFNGGKILRWTFIVIESGLMLWIIGRTFKDNANPLFFIVAFLTKIPLSLLFVFNLMSVLNPPGKTARDRSNARGNALIWLLFLTPLIAALVRNKNGFFNPQEILVRRGVRY